ncbi:hypothetical protein FYK55_21835 [Roseiconus nitratireducens]|uniref:Uncharacterized protein n=1 Tax=Roseiconus nitratireducens TaxID=2605748 RepID=A0A5M6D0Q7_9BACT|nr:hypothetical protein [Roseiconus nitratireducens]KAA5540270.1 hypothetical protein FYK55_21835 [Roseiconus nitratireducens]
MSIASPPLAKFNRRRGANLSRVKDLESAPTNRDDVRHSCPFTLTDLQALDDILRAATLLAHTSPVDARRILKPLLASLLRLCWAMLKQSPRVDPEPATLPLKLYQRQLLSKAGMKRYQKAIKGDTPVGSMLQQCRDLLVWLSGDRTAVID